jgi:hypothetical protein
LSDGGTQDGDRLHEPGQPVEHAAHDTRLGLWTLNLLAQDLGRGAGVGRI